MKDIMKQIITLCILTCSLTLTNSTYGMLKQCYRAIQLQQNYTQKRNCWIPLSLRKYPSDEALNLRDELIKLERQIKILEKENEMLLATIDNYNQTSPEQQKNNLQ
jgi:hypothetical protein